jgi:hypothetical protein
MALRASGMGAPMSSLILSKAAPERDPPLKHQPTAETAQPPNSGQQIRS